MSFQFDFGDDVLGAMDTGIDHPTVSIGASEAVPSFTEAPITQLSETRTANFDNNTNEAFGGWANDYGSPDTAIRAPFAGEVVPETTLARGHDASTMPPPSPRVVKTRHTSSSVSSDGVTTIPFTAPAVSSMTVAPGTSAEDEDNPTIVPPHLSPCTKARQEHASNNYFDKAGGASLSDAAAISSSGGDELRSDHSARTAQPTGISDICVAVAVNEPPTREQPQPCNYRMELLSSPSEDGNNYGTALPIGSKESTAHAPAANCSHTAMTVIKRSDGLTSPQTCSSHTLLTPSRSTFAAASPSTTRHTTSNTTSHAPLGKQSSLAPTPLSTAPPKTNQSPSSVRSPSAVGYKHEGGPNSLSSSSSSVSASPFISQQARTILAHATEALTKANGIINAEAAVALDQKRELSHNDAVFTTKMSSISHSATRQSERLDQLSSDYAVKQLSMLAMLGPLEKEPQLATVFKNSLPPSLHGAPAVHFMPLLLHNLETVLESLQIANERHAGLIGELMA